jgi:hypothetical protein
MRHAESTVERYFGNPEVLLGFMRRTRKPVFHKSNVFFRDIQHAIGDYFERELHDPKARLEVERMALHVVERYVTAGVLRAVNNQAYVLNMPAFGTPAIGTYAMLTFHGAPLAGPVEAE